MIVKRSNSKEIRFQFTDETYPEYNFPSVNALMESAAVAYGKRLIGVLLTGMGQDGATGMQAIKSAGGTTFAQDKKSSVVFGMPKVAIERGCIDHTLSIHEMGNFLVNTL